MRHLGYKYEEIAVEEVKLGYEIGYRILPDELPIMLRLIQELEEMLLEESEEKDGPVTHVRIKQLFDGGLRLLQFQASRFKHL